MTLNWEKVAASLEKSAQDAREEYERSRTYNQPLLAAQWIFARLAHAIRAGLYG